MTKTKELIRFVRNSRDLTRPSSPEKTFWNPMMEFLRSSLNKYLSIGFCPERKGRS